MMDNDNELRLVRECGQLKAEVERLRVAIAAALDLLRHNNEYGLAATFVEMARKTLTEGLNDSQSDAATNP
ncbi:MAG: hypothetical protein J2P16_01120 [Mycobacterium sp.]|nr:hypothetical protein [Mycobacterium sp.]